MITLFLAGLASVAVGPLLAIFVANRSTNEATTNEPVSAGMFVARTDNSAVAARRAA